MLLVDIQVSSLLHFLGECGLDLGCQAHGAVGQQEQNDQDQGGNEQVLVNSGIRTDRIKLFVFMLSGFCAASAGVLLAAQISTAHPTQGDNYQTDAIAACVIGGINMAGGEGKVWCTMVGALIIGSVRNILNLLHVSVYLQNIIVGIIIIAVVAFSMMMKTRREEKTSQFIASAEVEMH